MDKRWLFRTIVPFAFLIGSAMTAEAGSGSNAAVVTTPPSVGNGVANGASKPAGSPSVGDGVANGVVKKPGAPSVGDGVANGTVKSSTVQQ